MALASARQGCLVSSSSADYKAWSGAGQNCNCNVFRLAGLDIARPGPDQTVNFHEIFPYGNLPKKIILGCLTDSIFLSFTNNVKNVQVAFQYFVISRLFFMKI